VLFNSAKCRRATYSYAHDRATITPFGSGPTGEMLYASSSNRAPSHPLTEQELENILQGGKR